MLVKLQIGTTGLTHESGTMDEAISSFEKWTAAVSLMGRLGEVPAKKEKDMRKRQETHVEYLHRAQM